MGKAAWVADRAVQIGALLFAAIYFVSGLLYLCLSYWDVTAQDFWRLYYVCLNYPWLESTLFKVNNHSVILPTLIWLANPRFFHGSHQVLFIIGLTLLLEAVSKMPEGNNETS